MKAGAATTLLFATFAFASPAPAPAAQPNAVAAPIAQPNPVPAHIIEERAPKKAKPPKNGGNNTNDTSAAYTVTPSRALQLGALSVGVMEIVKMWP
jgi:hypothetical protein